MEKDEFFIKRIRELANLSYQRNIVTFSDFLNLNEQNIVSSLKHQFPQIVMETSGGYENAERQMVAFHPDALAFTWEYPIDCLRIEPKALKFNRCTACIGSSQEICRITYTQGLSRCTSQSWSRQKCDR